MTVTAFMLGMAFDNGPVLKAGYHRGDIRVVPCRPVGALGMDGRPVLIREDIREPLLSMIAAAAADGHEIKINYGFRDKQQQRQQYRKSRRFAAKPGFSNHQAGISIDIDGTRTFTKKKRRPTPLYHWLKANAPQYGFINDVPKEPWHWTWVRGPEENLPEDQIAE